jgi:oxygen-independent coproporphyrinogen-3 oxidase
MSAVPPSGDPVPADGSLPESALAGVARTPLSLYLHVPFCAARCGYCDFNTYTAADLGAAPGGSQADYLTAVRQELDLAARVLGKTPKISSVYFGGGTPTVLPAGELAALLDAVRQRFPLAKNAEITTEANPESVNPATLAILELAGFNRISFGMQSAVPRVLQTLERRHTLGRVSQVVDWAREAGFRSVSLDLIYGTPGETEADWRASLESALIMRPDHVSAYSLTLEPGTRLARRVAVGELPPIDEDSQADFYNLADSILASGGLHNYETSNWARRGHRCKHNLGYWHSTNWWGIGPGAHSHIGGVRWWNVRHPRNYVAALAGGNSPAQAREVLTDEQRRMEQIMLGLRLDEGFLADLLTRTEQKRIPKFLRAGTLELADDRYRLTFAGRLLADGIARDLLD